MKVKSMSGGINVLKLAWCGLDGALEPRKPILTGLVCVIRVSTTGGGDPPASALDRAGCYCSEAREPRTPQSSLPVSLNKMFSDSGLMLATSAKSLEIR